MFLSVFAYSACKDTTISANEKEERGFICSGMMRKDCLVGEKYLTKFCVAAGLKRAAGRARLPTKHVMSAN